MMNYVIQFYDGKELVVSEKAGLAILEAKTEKLVIKGQLVSLKSIARCYPERVEEEPLVLPPPRKFTKAQKINAVDQMIIGLKKFMKNNPHTNKSINLLAKMEAAKLNTSDLPAVFDPATFLT